MSAQYTQLVAQIAQITHRDDLKPQMPNFVGAANELINVRLSLSNEVPTAANNANEILASYPNLYLYASLISAYEFTNEIDMAQHYIARYENEVERYFITAAGGISPTLVMGGVPMSVTTSSTASTASTASIVPAVDASFATVAAMAAATGYSNGNLVQCVDYAIGSNAGIMFFVAVPPGTGAADGGSFIDGVGVQWQQLFAAGIRSIKQYGAVGNGVTDNTAVFNVIKNSSHQNWLVPDGTYNGTVDFGDNSTFRLTENALIAGFNWFPRLSIQDKEWININKTNKTLNDPSPAVVNPGEYIPLDTAQAQEIYLINQWGKQVALPADPGAARIGRTSVEALRVQVNHSGAGDCYALLGYGFITKPATASTPEAPYLRSGDHSNVGMGGGQITAGSEQVTLYGWGDIKLVDNGYQTVGMRGVVVLLHASGQNDVSHQGAPAYHADQFCYMGRSQGTGDYADIDVIYTAIGPAKAAFDCSAGVLVDTGPDPANPIHFFSALNMAEGHRICYNATPATAQTGYVSPDPGLFWSSYNGLSVEHTGQQNMPGLPTFADETAAASLATGDLYQTATGELRIKL